MYIYFVSIYIRYTYRQRSIIALGSIVSSKQPSRTTPLFEILDTRPSFDHNIHVERIHAANCMPNVLYYMLLCIHMYYRFLYYTDMHNAARCCHVTDVCYTIHRDRWFETGEKG